VGADAAARPWEAVGGVGFDQAAKKERAPVYVPLFASDCLRLPPIASDCEEGTSARVRAAEDATLVHASAHHDAPPLPHRYVPPKTRPELKPSSAEAPAVAEEFNDAAVRAFKEKEYQRSYVLWPLMATDCLPHWAFKEKEYQRSYVLWPLLAFNGL
jgi:hypothetical protein